MKPIPRALRPALAKLIRLLTSDVDGEVLATARAIGRTLKAGSCDIHDLAGLVEAPSTTPEASFHDHFDDDDDDETDWERMVDACADHPGRFTSREWQFIKSMQHWYGTPTSKQLDWLVACSNVCGGRHDHLDRSHTPARSAPRRRQRRRLIPRRTTRACAPIAVRAGRGTAVTSAASASPGAKGARFARIYFPLRHPDTDNFDPATVARWLKDHIAAGVNFITQNGLYDWGWLRADLGIAMPPSNQLEEIGALATLIDENRFNYGLDALCDWRGLPGKDTTLLEEAIKAAGFKISKKTPLQSYIWQMPARYVGAYAEGRSDRHAEAI